MKRKRKPSRASRLSPKLGDLVLVEWLDHSAGDGSWKHSVVDIDQDPVIVRSVGWLLRRSKNTHVLVATVGKYENGDKIYNEDHVIVSSTIVGLVPLRIGRVPK